MAVFIRGLILFLFVQAMTLENNVLQLVIYYISSIESSHYILKLPSA